MSLRRGTSVGLGRLAEADHREQRDVLRTRKRIDSAGPERSTDSSTVGDTSPRDALRGKRHGVTFHAHLARPGLTPAGEAGLLK